jgi:hypothetical protein
MIKNRLVNICSVGLLALSLLALPATARAQESSEAMAPPFFFGSILLSILHLPVKLVTCVGTQVAATVPYVATFGVPGHYDGGTNGRDIGETARRSCTGDWVVKPSHVKADYGS